MATPPHQALSFVRFLPGTIKTYLAARADIDWLLTILFRPLTRWSSSLGGVNLAARADFVWLGGVNLVKIPS